MRLERENREELEGTVDDVLDRFNDKLKEQEGIYEDINKQIKENLDEIEKIDRKISDINN